LSIWLSLVVALAAVETVVVVAVLVGLELEPDYLLLLARTILLRLVLVALVLILD
jgi:hypothetical protein